MPRATGGLFGVRCCLTCLLVAGCARATASQPSGGTPSAFGDASGDCHEAALHLKKGTSLFASKLYPLAIQELRAALALCPQREDAGVELARVYLAARRFPEAEGAAQDVLKQDPRSEPAQL